MKVFLQVQKKQDCLYLESIFSNSNTSFHEKFITGWEYFQLKHERCEKMQNEDERKWFELHKVPPELAELYRYFDRRVLRYRTIIMILLIVIVVLLLK